MKLGLLRQKITESAYFIEPMLALFLVLGIVLHIVCVKKMAFRLLSQAHRTTRLNWIKLCAEKFIFSSLSIHHAITPSNDPKKIIDLFGKRIIALKEPNGTKEKGVLLVKFSELLSEVAAAFNMEKLLDDYQLVFEPSWSGYCDTDFFHYTKYRQPIYFLAAERGDYAFLERLNKNLVPVDLGPCDWVDPAIAEPFLTEKKIYDIVMNSNWGSWKRHHVLFEAMQQLPKNIKVALIGFEWGGRTQKNIENLAQAFGVLEQLSFFQKIPYEKVMQINCQSKMAILLSLKEGSNRAIGESLFCDIPSIVLKEHVGGIVKNIVPETGALVQESNLAAGILEMLNNLGRYSPRHWAMTHVAYQQSTDRLNTLLKESAFSQRLNWTIDIAYRSNSPELRYVDKSAKERFSDVNKHLKSYLND